MAGEKLHLRVITPSSIKYDRHADMVIMRCNTGDWGVLPHHEPNSATLDFGILRIIEDNAEKRMAVFGGIAQVKDNEVTILAQDAMWPEDIDIEHVKRQREEHEARLRECEDDTEIRNVQVMLRRALVQIEVSDYPLLSKIDRGGEK